jgi:hypothetical protein
LSARVETVSRELHTWYFDAVEGTRVSPVGRPRATSYRQLELAMQELVRGYRERFAEGDVKSPLVRQNDLAARVGVSERTIRRSLREHGLTFETFRTAVESQLPH